VDACNAALHCAFQVEVASCHIWHVGSGTLLANLFIFMQHMLWGWVYRMELGPLLGCALHLQLDISKIMGSA